MAPPQDIARWLFWVQLRRMLPVERPRLVRSALPLWRLQHMAARRSHALLTDEYRRSLGQCSPELIAAAYRVAWRTHYEELLLGKLTAQNIEQYVVFEGRDRLDRALERKKGAILLLPHAGSFMMMIAAVSLAGYPYTQYAARGLAPEEVARAHPELFGHNPWRAEVRAAREAAEDRLPAKFLTMETPLRQLYRSLAANELIGIAFDGRIGRKFVPVSWLGRQALINPGPYRMALSTGAAIVPTFVKCPPHGPNVCSFGEPIFPSDHADAPSLSAAFLRAAEGWVRANPEQYGTWLLHCRERAGVDDHPLFTDYAPDDRWKVYLKGEGAEDGQGGPGSRRPTGSARRA